MTFEMSFADIPEGTFIEVENKALLLWRGVLLCWDWSGYQPYYATLTPTDQVKVLTPYSIVNMLQDGFSPQVHQSANAACSLDT